MGSQVGIVDGMFHVLLVSFPGQGHVNPLLRLGKRLASKGLLVTFTAPESVGREMRKANSKISGEPTPYGDGMIRFEFFDDEFDHAEPKGADMDYYLDHLKKIGTHKITEMVKKQEDLGRPICCLINNPFIPWVADVADNLGVRNAMLWVQSCASFSCYYHYYHKLVPFPSLTEPETAVKLPCMPLLNYDEVPSFLHPSSPLPFLARAILGQFENLSKPFCVLMDTFQDLEGKNLEHVSRICPVRTVGPLFKDPVSVSSEVRGDFVKADDCTLGWLDSKPQSSVVYISFGSIVILTQEQIDEIAHGLLNSGLNFLWSMKPPSKGSAFKPVHLPEGFEEKAGEKGRVVQWCPQEKVLAHPSVACFVTHCGWNSSMEALTIGVPIVAFPQWGDQVTNAKYLVDVFKTGIRLCRGEAEGRIIPRDEIEKCLLEATAGEKAEEMKANAAKWRKKAEAAAEEGGSSDRNLQQFVDEITMLLPSEDLKKNVSNKMQVLNGESAVS